MTDQTNPGLAANSTHKFRAATTHSPKLRMIGPDQVAEVHPGLLVLVTFEFYPYFDLSIALSALKNAVDKTEKHTFIVMSGFCDCFLVPERLQYTHVQPKTTHYTLLCFLRTVMSTHHNWFHAHLKETFRGEACLGGWDGLPVMLF
jgi:hypothetical protein